MATRKVKDLAVKVSEFQDASGNTKGRWENIGGAFKTDDGGSFILIKRTFNPAGVPDLTGRGGDMVMVSMFDVDDQNQGGGQGSRGQQRSAPPQGQQRRQAAPQNSGAPQPVDDFDDDIPF